ncbi:hypothetical protein [Marinitenerispora sediminis]|uniref:Uncharacterized protein n=1 Tax=Marinitenerispora sediminis TaxID=1931232 RepID=A0A368SZN3_9ACTN|nr:hypothetical protein [Marinitenerispora sediminis]RCV48073.1 hypothetical protein DEF28_24560 [Marinitenerispora sediminis]RCV51430.1 hypothetical protein DEF24_23215 [Marinitenerispora sediminis]RCV57702.1 hypothetical protein DEF23_10355 [Marinitenerispora sediminis]
MAHAPVHEVRWADEGRARRLGTALQQSRPVLPPTSDPGDMSRLVEGPERPQPRRIAVARV